MPCEMLAAVMGRSAVPRFHHPSSFMRFAARSKDARHVAKSVS